MPRAGADVVARRGGEARPPRAVIILRLPEEERGPAGGADVRPPAEKVVVLPAERRFRSALPHHPVLLGGEGFFPFLVCLRDLPVHGTPPFGPQPPGSGPEKGPEALPPGV